MCYDNPLNSKTGKDLEQISRGGWKHHQTRIINDYIQNTVLYQLNKYNNKNRTNRNICQSDTLNEKSNLECVQDKTCPDESILHSPTKQITNSQTRTPETEHVTDWNNESNNNLSPKTKETKIFTPINLLEKLYLIFQTTSIRNENDKSTSVIIRTTKSRRNSNILTFIKLDIPHIIRDESNNRIKQSHSQNQIDTSFRNNEYPQNESEIITLYDKIEVFENSDASNNNVLNNFSHGQNRVRNLQRRRISNNKKDSIQYCKIRPKKNLFFKNHFNDKLLNLIFIDMINEFEKNNQNKKLERENITDFIISTFSQPFGLCQFEFPKFFQNYKLMNDFVLRMFQNNETNTKNQWSINPKDEHVMTIDASTLNDEWEKFLFNLIKHGITQTSYLRILRSFNLYCRTTHKQNVSKKIVKMLDKYTDSSNWEENINQYEQNIDNSIQPSNNKNQPNKQIQESIQNSFLNNDENQHILNNNNKNLQNNSQTEVHNSNEKYRNFQFYDQKDNFKNSFFRTYVKGSNNNSENQPFDLITLILWKYSEKYGTNLNNIINVSDFINNCLCFPIGNCELKLSRFFTNITKMTDVIKTEISSFRTKYRNHVDHSIISWNLDPLESNLTKIDESTKTANWLTFIMTIKMYGITAHAYKRLLDSFHLYCKATVEGHKKKEIITMLNNICN